MSEMKRVFDDEEVDRQLAEQFLIDNPHFWEDEVELGNTTCTLEEWAMQVVEAEGAKKILNEWRKQK